MPVVTTRIGRVRGRDEEGTCAFLGIPFAAPPVGPLRFAPPHPAAVWEATRDCTTYGPTALQPNRGATLIPEPLRPGDNVLNLNIFTPDLGSARLPVLVWIHGGGFTSGCNSSAWYRGTRFARDGVVLVSVNYRLGIEGFLYVPDAPAPTNRGVLDWLAALEWVHEHIAAFGGDPTNVTVAGQSAGGGACETLLAVPRARGLFRRSISMSGVAQFTSSLEQADALSQRLGDLLGGPLTCDSLTTLSDDRLLAAQAALLAPPEPTTSAHVEARAREYSYSTLRGRRLRPCVDGDVLPLAPFEAIRGGVGNELGLMVGSTAEEFNHAFAPQADGIPAESLQRALEQLRLPSAQAEALRAEQQTGVTAGDVLGQAVSDSMFRVPAALLAEARVAAGSAPTHAYELRWRSAAQDGLLGACHCLDIPFAFDVLDAEGVTSAAGPNPPQTLADAMHAAWVGFANGGDPGWPAYNLELRPTMLFDATSGIANDPLGPERRRWERVLGLLVPGVQPR